MLKIVSAVAAVAMLAGASLILPALTPEAIAVVPAAKSDRADNPGSCDRQGWPYYEANCLRDVSRNAARVPQVRVISTDRVQLPQPAAPDSQVADAETPANPLAVPAWPDHIANLQVLVTR